MKANLIRRMALAIVPVILYKHLFLSEKEFSFFTGYYISKSKYDSR